MGSLTHETWFGFIHFSNKKKVKRNNKKNFRPIHASTFSVIAESADCCGGVRRERETERACTSHRCLQNKCDKQPCNVSFYVTVRISSRSNFCAFSFNHSGLFLFSIKKMYTVRKPCLHVVARHAKNTSPNRK